MSTVPDRAAIVARYSDLAKVAAAGARPTDPADEARTNGCGAAAYTDESRLDVPESALRASMGCGNPVAVAQLRPGDVVLDLGSGGGLDVLLSARRVGPTGYVYGIDASEDMLDLAHGHVREAGADNVEFRRGHLEEIPLADGSVDVVISNCVFTLSTDKTTALAEAARVLRPGGRFGITDIIAEPGLDPDARVAAERSVGCSVGTFTADEYRDELAQAGLCEPRVTVTHKLDDGIHSAIVQARKPA